MGAEAPARLRILRIMTRMNIGGPAIHVALLTGGLSAARFSTCLVIGQPEASEGDLSDLLQGMPAGLIRLDTLRRRLHPWRDLRSLAALARITWRQRPHIIHTHMAKAGTLGRLAGVLYNTVGPGRRSGERAVLVHTFHGHVLEGYFSERLSRAFLAIERWLAARTDCLIAVSQAVRDDLLRKGIGRPAQWRVIPIGLELSGLSRLEPSNGSAVRIGVVGRLVPIKNTSLLIQALALVHRRERELPVRGIIVGDGPLRARLEREAQHLGVAQAVTFLGWQRDIRAVYERLEIACLTSWNEGTPVSMIEAMAAGRAVVATDVGGVRDVLGGGHSLPPEIPRGQFHVTPCGVLVQPGDVEGLAAALSALARDEPLRKTLGQAARAYALKSFGAARLIEQVTALYEETGEGRNSCMR